MSSASSAVVDSDGEGEESPMMFQCKKCPGKLFTTAEKDAHRQMHRDQKKAARKRKPGPKTRRTLSPVGSERTLFIAASPPESQEEEEPEARQSRQTGVKRGRAADRTPAGQSKRKKIKSNKKTNEPVSFDTTTGG